MVSKLKVQGMVGEECHCCVVQIVDLDQKKRNVHGTKRAWLRLLLQHEMQACTPKCPVNGLQPDPELRLKEHYRLRVPELRVIEHCRSFDLLNSK